MQLLHSLIISANKTAAILYLTDSENYGRDSVASQYFMQLAEYVRLPVISWTADNSAFEQGSLQLQLAPTIKHQVGGFFNNLSKDLDLAKNTFMWSVMTELQYQNIGSNY